MLIKLTPEEFEQHVQALEDPEALEPSHAFMRLGVCVNQWDNGMGAGVIMLSTLQGTKVTYLHYQ